MSALVAILEYWDERSRLCVQVWLDVWCRREVREDGMGGVRGGGWSFVTACVIQVCDGGVLCTPLNDYILFSYDLLIPFCIIVTSFSVCCTC